MTVGAEGIQLCTFYLGIDPSSTALSNLILPASILLVLFEVEATHLEPFQLLVRLLLEYLAL